MKKQLFSLALLLSLGASFAGSTFAADQRTIRHDQRKEERKGPDAGQRSAKMAQELGLSTKQKTKVEQIFRQQQQQMQALRSRSGGAADRNSQLAEAKRIHESTDKQLKSVLSKKQYAQLETKRQERQRQMSQRNTQRRDDQRRDYGGRGRS